MYSSLPEVLTYLQCNEEHPICGGCQRHGVQCIYSSPTIKTPGEREAKQASKNNVPGMGIIKPDLEYPESEQRRLLELRLMYQWLTKSAFSFPGSDDKDHREAMLLTVPDTALKCPAWLYTIFAFSAMHIAKTSSSPTERREFTDTFQKYFDLALQEHRRDVAGLCRETANNICMTSSLIRNCTQALVQDRDLVPYSPPSQWLHMMHGSGDVFRTAWDWISDDESCLVYRISTSGPNLSDLDELFSEKNRAPFTHLLPRSPANRECELGDREAQRAYDLTLSYIGSIQIAHEGGEKKSHTFKRVIAFPMFAPKRYIEMVEEGRPRALVILAHYLSFLARLRGFWWVGDTGRREILAIQSVLESPWLEMLEWPLQKMEEVWDLKPWEYP